MGKYTVAIFLVLALSGCGFMGGFWSGLTGQDEEPVDEFQLPENADEAISDALEVGLAEMTVDGTSDRGRATGEYAGKAAKKGLETGSKSLNPVVAVPCGVVLFILGLFGVRKARRRKEK